MSTITEEVASDRTLSRKAFSAYSASLGTSQKKILINGIVIWTNSRTVSIEQISKIPGQRLARRQRNIPETASEDPLVDSELSDLEAAPKIQRTLTLTFSTATNDPTEIVGGVAQEFLHKLYTLSKRSDAQDASDYVFRYFDDLLYGRKFRVCRAIFTLADESKLPSSILRALLVTTASVKDKIGTRVSFFKRAYDQISQQSSEKKADRLLGRLV